MFVVDLESGSIWYVPGVLRPPALGGPRPGPGLKVRCEDCDTPDMPVILRPGIGLDPHPDAIEAGDFGRSVCPIPPASFINGAFES